MAEDPCVTGRVEDNVLIDLIADDEAIVGCQHLGQTVAIGRRQQRAGWIVRRVDHDQTRSLIQRILQPVEVDTERRAGKRQMDRLCPGERDRRLIGVVGRIENDDFIAGSCERDNGAEQGLRRAARYGDLGLRIDDACEALGNADGNRLAQPGDSGHRRILIHTARKRVGDELDQPGGRVEIGKTLRKVDRRMLLGQPAHHSKDRRAGVRQLAGGCRYGHCLEATL